MDRDAAVDSADSIEAERKFYLWKATTTAYLDETIGLDEPQCRKEREDLAKEKASIFCDYLGCLSTSKDQRLVRTITSIVLEALELDLLISRQVARVKWVYSINNGPQRFNQGLMDAEEEPGDYIYLFLAPALVKQGKSNGDDFDKSTILLKSQVICGPGDATVQSESHRGSAAESGRSFGSRMAKTLRTAVRGLPPGA